MDQEKSNQQYDETIARCKKEFVEKNKKYKGSLSAYDAVGIAEKNLIKIVRVRTIQKKGKYLVSEESIDIVFPEIINYTVYGITLANQIADGTEKHFENDELFSEYDKAVACARELFQKKNHDYGEAWRDLTISFMTKECHTKLKRLINIYGDTKFSEETEARVKLQKDFLEIFYDVLNYCVFCTIRINEVTDPMI